MMLCVLVASAQRFFNLTADEVSIDSVLPHFTYAVSLDGQYDDSLYVATIEYPEFIDMSASDIDRYHANTNAPLPALPEVNTQVVVARKKGTLEVDFVPLVCREGKYRILASFMLRVESKPRPATHRAARRADAASRYAEHSVLATGRWAKISVAASGVCQLTDEVIRKAGFTNLSRVKIYGYGGALQNEKLIGDELAELDDLKEVPTCNIGGRRLFYGQGPVTWETPATMRRTRNPYSNYGYYFITESEEEPLTVDSTAFVSAFYPSAADHHVLHEVDNYAWFNGGRNLFENTPVSLGSSKEYTIGRAGQSASGRIAVCVSGGTTSTVQVAVNDSVVGTLSFTIGDYDSGNQSIGIYDIPDLREQNTVRITPLTGGTIRLDYIDVYTPDARQAPSLSSAAFPAAEYVYNITNQDLHADPAVDMVIIIPTTQHLRTQAQRLADFHQQHDGLRVRIVPADELFNEFASGTPDANAYRRYLKMHYDRAQTEADMPRYLLLFGDGYWDNRMVTPECRQFSPDDFLLCFEGENSFSKTDCYVDDGFFCLLDEGEGTSLQLRDKEDVAVGRFPVRNEDEAKVMVDKTIAYAQNNDAGAWQNVIMFMGDDGDNNTHMTDVNSVADIIESEYPGYHIKKVMWDAYTREVSSTGSTYPDAAKIIKQQQADGALIMDYGGHGSEISISHEHVLLLSDFQQFTNKHLPLWVTASCNIMPFDGTKTNIGEEAVLNSRGGAVAFFGTTREVWTNYNKVINRAFMRQVLTLVDGKPLPLGEAVRLTKNHLIASGEDTSNNKLHYVLLGDPALALNLPTQQIVIDSINGEPVGTGDYPQLSSGATVRVAGHVAAAGGGIDGTFSGLVSATVRDTREWVVCKVNNTSEARTPFRFYDRQNILFNGTDSIRDGKFVFTFAVPMDINYSSGTGLMNLYAVSSQRSEAHGSCSAFTVNGSSGVVNDGIGPSIYCYLNSPSFTDGGDVNATPYFVAKITDKDGINSTGSGIGHDMELVIDGQTSRTYHLNDHFSFDFGNYTSGSTFYSIPELEPGYHRLLFRAWDILNNSSTAELSFRVVKGLEPTLFSVSCTDNPATTTTTFIVNHDRTGSPLDVVIEVFDMSGRQLWSHSESGVPSDGSYTTQWNLTIDGGRRLQTGVYLYRVLVSNDGSTQASKAKKLIVVGNK